MNTFLGEFDAKNISQDLNRLIEGDLSIEALRKSEGTRNKQFDLTCYIAEYEMKNAMASCSCVLRYLKLLGDDSNFGKYILKHHDLSQYMRLDGSALAALSLMPTSNEATNRSTSLYGLLNKCKTAQGSRLFSQWLKQPLLNLQEIGKKKGGGEGEENNRAKRDIALLTSIDKRKTTGYSGSVSGGYRIKKIIARRPL